MTNSFTEKLIDSCPVMIFSLDVDGSLIALGGGLVAVMGLSQDLIGEVIFKNSSFPIRRSHFKRVVSGKKISCSTQINDKTYETELIPVFDQNNKLQSVSGLSLDVTKNMQVDRQMDEERHRIFASQRLNSLATVTNGIAHEINNPLAIISGYTEQLRDLFERNPKNVPIQRVTLISNKIIEASRRCSQIIDSLKDFSRNGSSDPFELEQVSHIVNECLDLCRQRIASCGIKLELGDLNRNTEVQCRKVQIVQVLFNLISNAIDASMHAEGEPVIRIDVKEENNNAVITVRDNGPGIPGSIKNKIFEPFFTTKEVGEGVGVGLSISKGVVEEHGGSLAIDEKDPLTCFEILLPTRQNVKTAI